jgi:hypothetical protein
MTYPNATRHVYGETPEGWEWGVLVWDSFAASREVARGFAPTEEEARKAAEDAFKLWEAAQ